MVKAHESTLKALQMMSQGDNMRPNCDGQIISECDCASTILHKERALHSAEYALLHAKLQLTVDEQSQQHSADNVGKDTTISSINDLIQHLK